MNNQADEPLVNGNTVALYVYCIGESDQLGRLLAAGMPEGIEPRTTLELVAEGRVSAVVSNVPLSEYNEEALRIRLEDPAWIAARAMRHEDVVEHFSSRTGVIPLRFGALYYTTEGVRMMLSERGTELLNLLQRLHGRQEWGVSVYKDQTELLTAITLASPRLRELTERAASASPGEAYLLQKKIDDLSVSEANAEARRAVGRIESELKLASERAVRLRVLKGEATAATGDMVARFAFLLPISSLTHFRAVAESLAEEVGRIGFRIELTGPLPPYDFASE